MKISFVVAAALLFATPSFAQSADGIEETSASFDATPSKESVVYIAPLSLIVGGIVVEYERAFSPGASFFVAPQLSLPFGLMSAFQTVGVSTFGVGAAAGARFYFTGKAPGGLFVGPELAVNYASASATTAGGDVSASGVGFGLSGTVGYSIVTDGGLAVSLGAGVGFGQSAINVSAGGETGSGSSGLYVFPSLRMHVGYAF